MVEGGVMPLRSISSLLQLPQHLYISWFVKCCPFFNLSKGVNPAASTVPRHKDERAKSILACARAMLDSNPEASYSKTQNFPWDACQEPDRIYCVPSMKMSTSKTLRANILKSDVGLHDVRPAKEDLRPLQRHVSLLCMHRAK